MVMVFRQLQATLDNNQPYNPHHKANILVVLAFPVHSVASLWLFAEQLDLVFQHKATVGDSEP
jgi:hypothetical protein